MFFINWLKYIFHVHDWEELGNAKKRIAGSVVRQQIIYRCKICKKHKAETVCDI